MGFVISFFTSKFGAYTLIILMVLGVVAYEKHHIAAVQHDKDQIVYDAMEKKLLGQIKELKDTAEAERQANEAAKAKFQVDAQATLAGVQKQLDLEKTKHAKTIVITKQVPTYVTTKADAQCTITAGFVWLHDSALRQNAGMADSPPGTPDAATAVKISAVASTLRDNYAECEERGAVIEGWQRWYNENKLNYERAMERPNGPSTSDTGGSGDWSRDLHGEAPGQGSRIAARGTGGGDGSEGLGIEVQDMAYQLF